MSDKKNNRTDTPLVDIYNNYREFYDFLGAFAADADCDIFDDQYTVKNIFTDDQVKNNSSGIYQEYLKVLDQSNEILSMEPFPCYVIENITNLWISQSYDEEIKAEKVKQWIRNVLHLLELRVTGKL